MVDERPENASFSYEAGDYDSPSVLPQYVTEKIVTSAIQKFGYYMAGIRLLHDIVYTPNLQVGQQLLAIDQLHQLLPFQNSPANLKNQVLIRSLRRQGVGEQRTINVRYLPMYTLRDDEAVEPGHGD